MDRLLQQLKSQRLSLIVACPANSLELALAAERSGAHAIKVHINMTHRASKVVFGTLDQERPVLEEILGRVRVPVGIVPGASLAVGPADIEALAGMGFDFFDMFAHFIRPQLLAVPGISRMAAVDSSFDWPTIEELTRSPGVQMLEGAIIPTSGYGERLSIVDLARYRLLRAHCHVPLVIPSQRTLIPDDVPALAEAGVDAIMIGVLSTGREPDELARQVAAFRQAIETLPPH